MSWRCIDYPCCGHTDGLPCDWTPPDYSSDPHLLCDHEAGVCEVDYGYEDEDDLEDDERDWDDPFADVPEDTPLALDS